MEINFDEKYSGRKLKGSEYAAILNLLVVLSLFLPIESSKKWTTIGMSKEHRIT